MTIIASSNEIHSFTLRIPESIRAKLSVEALSLNKSINEHIRNVLETHLIEVGFSNDGVVTPSGRVFKIEFTEEKDRNQGDLIGSFGLVEARFNKRRATYMIGLARELVEDWRLGNPIEAIRELGFSVLCEYAKSHEIDRLSWRHPRQSDFDGFKVFTHNDLQAATLLEFFDKLHRGAWKDNTLIVCDESQDIRRRRRVPANLYQ